MKVRNAMALAGVTRVLTPLMVLLPLLSLLIWIMVGQGLAPLKRLAGAVAMRTPRSLEPLPTDGAPSEVMPLVDSLNDLLRRLDEALAAQKAFVADAAHELRTPITALQLQAQLIERAQSDAERSDLLDDLKAGVRRCAHLVGQLLTLARQDPDLAGRPSSSLALGELARQVVADHASLAATKQIDLGLAVIDEFARVQGDEEALRILLRNLTDNAIRYTPRGGSVEVAIISVAGRPCIEVSDSGPGIAEKDRARIFDRFYRGEGVGETGTGLGLSIVRAIADRHQATIELGDAEAGGLRIRVVFPRPNEESSPL
jgi:two-component system OmpR family sensor kinase